MFGGTRVNESKWSKIKKEYPSQANESPHEVRRSRLEERLFWVARKNRCDRQKNN